MTAAMPRWLEGANVLVVGGCAIQQGLANALERMGAAVERSGHATSLEEAVESLRAGAEQGCAVDRLVHIEPDMAMAASETITSAGWRAALGATLDSSFFCASAFAQQQFKAARSGDIVLLVRPSDGAGRVAAATARGGIGNLVQTLAVEWARDGIRVNAIESGILGGGEQVEVETLASLCSYLLSDFSSYVTGAVVGVNDIPAS